VDEIGRFRLSWQKDVRTDLRLITGAQEEPPMKGLIATGILALGVAAFAMTGPAGAAKAGLAIGTWLHPDNGSHIRISRCGGGICGTVVRVRDRSRTDINNKDPKLRKRKILGLRLFSGMKKDRKDRWKGKLYNTADGGTYRGFVTVISKSKIKLEGCWGPFCKSKTWTRVR